MLSGLAYRATVTCFVSRQGGNPSPPDGSVSCTTSVGYLTYIWASAQAGIAVTAVIASQQCVVAAIIGTVTLRERLSRGQLAGTGMIIAGVSIAAFAR